MWQAEAGYLGQATPVGAWSGGCAGDFGDRQTTAAVVWRWGNGKAKAGTGSPIREGLVFSSVQAGVTMGGLALY